MALKFHRPIDKCAVSLRHTFSILETAIWRLRKMNIFVFDLMTVCNELLGIFLVMVDFKREWKC